jgi:simple sugar transport system permease protein/ribose transport system permease protein
VAAGALNALLVVRLRLHAFAATLGTLIALGGLQAGFTDGRELTTMPDSVASLDGASLVICGLIFAAAIAFAGLFRHGRSLYAVGGNADAARAAGIRPGRVLWAVFVAGGALAALAGLLMTARAGSVAAANNPSAILLVLAAALVGGVSLDGGKGTVFGALCGVLVFGLADNLMRLGGVASVWVQAVYGGIVLVALIAARILPRGAGGGDDR